MPPTAPKHLSVWALFSTLLLAYLDYMFVLFVLPQHSTALLPVKECFAILVASLPTSLAVPHHGKVIFSPKKNNRRTGLGLYMIKCWFGHYVFNVLPHFIWTDNTQPNSSLLVFVRILPDSFPPFAPSLLLFSSSGIANLLNDLQVNSWTGIAQPCSCKCLIIQCECNCSLHV